MKLKIIKKVYTDKFRKDMERFTPDAILGINILSYQELLVNLGIEMLNL